MGIKKMARPINKAKNDFIKWLKDNNADCINIYVSKETGAFGYYIDVSAFVGQSFYHVCFMIWRGEVKISYADENCNCKEMSINELMQLIKDNGH